MWCFKQSYKHYKKLKVVGDISSILLASGGITSAILTSGVALVAIGTGSIIIQTWLKHKNIDEKIHDSQYAYQTYSHLLNETRYLEIWSI